MSATNAPARRIQHAAVWTGSRMIVWGGNNGPDPLQGTRIDGAAYDPAADAWSPIATEGAPSPRARFSVVWTGKVMIVWGGQDEHGQPLGDGHAYDPIADRWKPLGTNAVTAKPRYAHTAVWTGSEMFVFAGVCATDACADGAAYNPSNDVWRTVSPHDAPTQRLGAAGVWTGREVLVWSGLGGDDGYRWEPVRDAWTRMQDVNAPAPRGSAFAFWTGDRMLVWGGANVEPSGAFYRP